MYCIFCIKIYTSVNRVLFHIKKKQMATYKKRKVLQLDFRIRITVLAIVNCIFRTEILERRDTVKPTNNALGY